MTIFKQLSVSYQHYPVSLLFCFYYWPHSHGREVMQLRPSVCFHSMILNRVTFDLDLLHVYGSWPYLSWNWRSRLEAQCEMRSVGPREDSFLVTDQLLCLGSDFTMKWSSIYALGLLIQFVAIYIIDKPEFKITRLHVALEFQLVDCWELKVMLGKLVMVPQMQTWVGS